MPPWAHDLYRWVTRTMHPSEADEIGRRLKLAGMSLESNAYHIGRSKGDLEQIWSGRAKERFFEDYGFARLPRRLEDLGGEIEEHGERIRQIRVTITERVLIKGESAQWE